jgi:hypothetical protein
MKESIVPIDFIVPIDLVKYPLLQGLINIISRANIFTHPDEFENECEKIFVDLSSSNEIKSCVAELIHRQFVQCESQIPNFLRDDDIVLFSSKECILTIRRIRAKLPAEKVYTPRSNALLSCLAGSVCLERFPIVQDSICNSRKDILHEGDYTIISAKGSEAFDLYKVSQSSAYVLRLLYGIYENDTFDMYLRSTQKHSQRLASRLEDSRLEATIRLLGEIGGTDVPSTLKYLTSHPVYFIRWSALQRLFEIDSDLAITELKKFLDDPCEELRIAARDALVELELL